MSGLGQRRVLVTGATGFIGGRVVEKLHREHSARVRALVRDLPRAVRVARFPVELVPGDVTDAASVQDAARGCDVVIHCAYGNRGDAEERHRVNVDGTRNVLEAALASGAARVVHLSTVMVYGVPDDGTLDETAPRRRCGDRYADTKLEAEELVLRYHHDRGLPVSVIQPTAVYGPFAPSWTERVLKQLTTGLVPLVNGGSGVLNTVYVDDAADAVLLAAVREEAVGEAFLISGAAVTYGEFYGRFERMLGEVRTVPLSEEECLARWAEGEDGRIHRLAPVWIRYQARTTRVSTEKARRSLGYRPAIDFETGMRLTEGWARWANLLPDRSSKSLEMAVEDARQTARSRARVDG